MNKIYKVVFCKAKQTFVAVSEFAKSKGKTSSTASHGLVSPAPRFKLAKIVLALIAVFGASQPVWAGLKDNNEGHNNNNANTVIIGSKKQTDPNTNTTAESQGIAIGHDAHAGTQGISIGTNTTSAGSNSSIAIGGDDTDAAGNAPSDYIKYQFVKNKVYHKDTNGYYYEENGTKYYATKSTEPQTVNWIYTNPQK